MRRKLRYEHVPGWRSARSDDDDDGDDGYPSHRTCVYVYHLVTSYTGAIFGAIVVLRTKENYAHDKKKLAWHISDMSSGLFLLLFVFGIALTCIFAIDINSM